MSDVFKKIVIPVIILIACTVSVMTAGANGKSHEIAQGVFSFTIGEGNHSMFVIGHDGVAVFETFHSMHARAMLAEIRRLTDKPVKYVFHSHNHWDHVSGGMMFEKTAAQTVMHQLAAQWLAANPGRDTIPAKMIWSGKRQDINMSDFTVEMRYLGLNHGLGLTLFTIPQRKVAYIADLVTPNRVMFSVVPDFNIGEWERTLSEILELEFDVAVCSHNELPGDDALKGCTREHVVEERQFIRDLRDAIIAELQKGTSFMDVPKTVKLPQYAHWVGYDDWLEMNTLRLMTDLWMGPFPWHPGE